jgi:hypothetical protein
MDFKLLVDSLLTGAPVAVLVALVGLVWEVFYAYRRDKTHDKQFEQEQKLERQKFEHQKELEDIKFQYEMRRWREDLGKELISKLMTERISSYAQLWKIMEGVATSRKPFTPDTTKDLAGQIIEWRYSKGGLLAEDVTRDAVFAFQQALWDYDGSRDKYVVIRQARKLVLRSIRADLGLGEDVSGQSIYEIAEKRQHIGADLAKFQTQQGMKKEEA